MMLSAVLLMSLLTAAPAASTMEPLRLDVTPRSCLSPGFVRAEATVMLHPDNRKLVLLADSIPFYSSITKELDGETDAIVHDMVFKQLPAGVYVVRAELTRTGGEMFVKEAVVQVHGSKIQ